MANDRNYGIDMYRIYLTVLICVLHVLSRGGILGSLEPGTFSFGIVWLLETVAYCAVDGYGLITGYNAREKEQDFKRIIKMWFQVFFYSFVFSGILYLAGLEGPMDPKTIIKSIFPATFGVYWYFSAYLPLSLLEPYIIKGLNRLGNKELLRLFIFIIGIFCFSGLLFNGYNTESGYSFLWLLLLYILGYTIKRLSLFEKWCNKKLILGCVILSVLSWLPKFILNTDILISFISPSVLFCAMFLLVLFKRIKPNIKLVKMVAPLTFGIYLCQNNRFIWELIKDMFVFVTQFNVFIMALLVIVCSLLVFIACGIVEEIRILVFKIICIDKISFWLNDLIFKFLAFVENKFVSFCNIEKEGGY